MLVSFTWQFYEHHQHVRRWIWNFSFPSPVRLDWLPHSSMWSPCEWNPCHSNCKNGTTLVPNHRPTSDDSLPNDRRDTETGIVIQFYRIYWPHNVQRIRYNRILWQPCHWNWNVHQCLVSMMINLLFSVHVERPLNTNLLSNKQCPMHQFGVLHNGKRWLNEWVNRLKISVLLRRYNQCKLHNKCFCVEFAATDNPNSLWTFQLTG